MEFPGYLAAALPGRPGSPFLPGGPGGPGTPGSVIVWPGSPFGPKTKNYKYESCSRSFSAFLLAEKDTCPILSLQRTQTPAILYSIGSQVPSPTQHLGAQKPCSVFSFSELLFFNSFILDTIM